MSFYNNVQALINSVPADDSCYTNDRILESRNVVIFGAGSFGINMARNLIASNRKINYFIDNDQSKHGNVILGIEVVSLEHFISNKDENVIIIICSNWHNQIRQQLLNAKILNFIEVDSVANSKYLYKFSEQKESFGQFFTREKEKFEEVYNILEDSLSKNIFLNLIAYRVTGNLNILKISEFEQYVHPNVKPEKGDIIIDGGAFIGDTAKQFNELLAENCIIHSFEPSRDNFEKMKEWVGANAIKNVNAVQSGLGKEKSELFMNSTEGEINAANIIVKHGNEKVSITTIDDYVYGLQLNDISLIKLDIEGYELSALQGADSTIEKFGSKLQICLYHKQEDLIDIPLYIYHKYKEKKYKYYLGHHRDNYMETVLYVIRDK